MKADFFKKLGKALLEDYKEEIKAFGEEANRPSVLENLLEEVKKEEIENANKKKEDKKIGGKGY